MNAKLIIFSFYVNYVFFTQCQDGKEFFRKDYHYIEDTKAFYKFHTIHRSWVDAKESCEFEGATLFYPYDENEANAILKFWNETQFFHWIYIGISTPNVPEVYETVDGLPVLQVYNKWRPGEPNNAGGKEGCVVITIDGSMNDEQCEKKFPYICKKNLNDLEWNTVCDLPDTAYEYTEPGRCYKFHLNPRTWQEAVFICAAEQSYLAVINSDREAEILVNITARANKNQVEDMNFMHGAVHLGFKLTERGWKTIKEQSLRQSGYSKWGGGQPDGKGEEKCGSMFYNGKLNDISCNQKCFFICEHEPALLAGSYDFRSGVVNSSV